MEDAGRYTVSEYRPDGGASASGARITFVVLALAGAALGYAAHWVAQLFWLVLVFPAAIGAVLGFAGMWSVKRGRVRHPMIGGLAGLFGGLLAMGVMHYADYAAFRSKAADLPQELRELAAKSPEEQALLIERDLVPEERRQLDDLLRLVAADSFFKFMDAEARQGVEINNTHGSSRGLNLGYYGSYIYWIVEILIVAVITFFIVREATSAPFCVPCDRWKETRKLGAFAGDAEAAARALREGDLRGLRRPAAEGSVTLRIAAAVCPGCGAKGSVDVKLERITVDKKGNEGAVAIAHVRYPGEGLVTLEGLLAAPPPASTSSGPTS